ncbi:hypothetical protein HAX54_002323 [Datura stramonium]|uniref:Lunapark zinc ribbon domain-containing protein n=1 Tax=Datura stramonium TaxID=4076 RepID=A0ABS8T3P9_DATST|nr:hypothetical protein [Datura stramonium]
MPLFYKKYTRFGDIYRVEESRDNQPQGRRDQEMGGLQGRGKRKMIKQWVTKHTTGETSDQPQQDGVATMLPTQPTETRKENAQEMAVDCGQQKDKQTSQVWKDTPERVVTSIKTDEDHRRSNFYADLVQLGTSQKMLHTGSMKLTNIFSPLSEEHHSTSDGHQRPFRFLNILTEHERFSDCGIHLEPEYGGRDVQALDPRLAALKLSTFNNTVLNRFYRKILPMRKHWSPLTQQARGINNDKFQISMAYKQIRGNVMNVPWMDLRSILTWEQEYKRIQKASKSKAPRGVLIKAALAAEVHDERKDQKTLERLRAERQAKIDELKEKTNYYITQQLIQRYDPDPASKAAAATVLASKLGADTGLKVYLGNESNLNAPTGKSNDVEVVQSAGLRNRKQPRSGSAESAILDHPEGEMLRDVQLEGSSMNQHQQMIAEHYNPTGSSTQDGGWLARIAALLVGEDPTQSYALICGNCHRHNGLARKEEFPYTTYYCPHCNALNRPKQLTDGTSGSSALNMASTTIAADAGLVKQHNGSMAERVSASSSPAVAAAATTEDDNIVSASSSPAVAAAETTEGSI